MRSRLTLGVARRSGAEGSRLCGDAIQVGGYEPSTVIDFEIRKKYGLRQTIADTLGNRWHLPGSSARFLFLLDLAGTGKGLPGRACC